MADPTTDPVADLLRRAPLSDAQRADLWDAYHAAASLDELTAKIQALPGQPSVKADLWDLKAKEAPAVPPPSSAPPQPAAPQTWADRLGLNTPTPPGTPWQAGLKGAAAGAVDLAQGAKAGLMSTVLGATDLANAVNSRIGGPVVNVDPATRASLTASPQTFSGYMGRGVETLGELAVPVEGAVQAIPDAARAARTFEAVKAAAGTVPVDTTAVGNIALRIQQLADRGATMPTPVTKFLNRLTDPNKGPMLYEEAKDFANNISRLSAVEAQKVVKNGPLAYELANLRVALNYANGQAAQLAGKGAEYAQAMSEYHKAMVLRDALTKLGKGAAGAAGIGTVGAAGAYAYHQLASLFGGD